MFNGEDITARSTVWRSRAGIRRTFQRQQIFGRLTVEENVLCATEWRGGGGGILADLIGLPTRRSIERRRRAEIDEVIERCGLESIRHTLAGSLPIGMARMVDWSSPRRGACVALARRTNVLASVRPKWSA